MTVVNTTRKVRYEGNGSSVDFDFAFKIFDESELEVYLVLISTGVATLQTLNTDYTVSIDTVNEGGTITFASAPSSLYDVFIRRELDPTQSADLPAVSNFSEVSIENALDRAVMLIIQLQEQLDRSIKFSETSEFSGVAFPDLKIGFLYSDGVSLDWSTPSTTTYAGSITRGAESSLPASPAAGDIYLTTDTGFIYFCQTAGTWTLYNPRSFRNKLINGNFDIWERGTSFTANAYTADRWTSNIGGGGSATISRQTFSVGQTDIPNNPKYYLRHNQTVAGSFPSIEQRLEGVETLSGKTVSISFYAKANATKTVGVTLTQNFGTGGTPSTEQVVTTGNVSLSTGWQKFILTFSLASISGKTLGSNNDDFVKLLFSFPASDTYTIDIAQIQMEEGAAASAFETRNIEVEKAMCQRYFEKSYHSASAPGATDTNGSATFTCRKTDQLDRITVPFRVSKRGNPTIVLYSTTGASGKIRNITDGADVAATVENVSMNAFTLYATADLTADKINSVQWTADNEL